MENDIRRLQVRATMAELLVAVLYKIVAPKKELLKQILDDYCANIPADDPDRDTLLEVAKFYTEKKIQAEIASDES